MTGVVMSLVEHNLQSASRKRAAWNSSKVTWVRRQLTCDFSPLSLWVPFKGYLLYRISKKSRSGGFANRLYPFWNNIKTRTSVTLYAISCGIYAAFGTQKSRRTILLSRHRELRDPLTRLTTSKFRYQYVSITRTRMRTGGRSMSTSRTVWIRLSAVFHRASTSWRE